MCFWSWRIDFFHKPDHSEVLKKTKCYQDKSSRASARPERPKFGRRNQSHLWNHFWVSLLQTCFYAAMFYSSFLMPVLLCDAVLFLALLLCLFALLTWLFNKVSLFYLFFYYSFVDALRLESNRNSSENSWLVLPSTYILYFYFTKFHKEMGLFSNIVNFNLLKSILHGENWIKS